MRSDTDCGEAGAGTADATGPVRAQVPARLPGRAHRRTAGSRSADSVIAVLLVILTCAVTGHLFGSHLREPGALATASTVFVSVVIQALPFLALGVVVSGILAVLVTPERVRRVLPRRGAAAVCVAGIGGFALPGCECGSVPVGRRLMDQGVPHAAALAFLLAAPAINPVVLVATHVAFPGRPEMMWARLAASLTCAIAVGLVWLRIGRADLVLARAGAHDHRGPWWSTMLYTARADMLTSGAFLVVGAGFVALSRVLLPAGWESALADQPALAVLAMAGLAVVLSLCSEADAFVAASFPGVGELGLLVFLVVGPAIDLKLGVMYVGVFGRRFAVRLVPVIAVAALGSALSVGALVLSLFGARPW